jgi:general stress protein YciG
MRKDGGKPLGSAYTMSNESTHERRVEAGRKGGEAAHECRGRECTHPSHKREAGSSSSGSTHEKLSEAGKKGAAAEPREAKVKGGKH